MSEKTFVVPTIGCNGCVNAIKGEIEELDGVTYVDGVVDSKTITVKLEAPEAWTKLVSVLSEIGYAPSEG